MAADPATPELTFREAAHFAAVGLGAVEKAVETRVLPADRPRGRRADGAAVRHLPLASVAYLAAVREAGLTDLALKHKRAIWGGVAGSGDDADAPPPVEFAPGTSIDVGRLAGEALARAARYARARDAHIVCDPEIKGGTPVIRGHAHDGVRRAGARRGRRDAGRRGLRQTPTWPARRLEAAVVYARTHPLRGRPGGRPWWRGTGDGDGEHEDAPTAA